VFHAEIVHRKKDSPSNGATNDAKNDETNGATSRAGRENDKPLKSKKTRKKKT
jgi:hypothetical protein